MSKHRDLVAFALDSDRPLTSAHDLTYVGGHHTLLDFETAVARGMRAIASSLSRPWAITFARSGSYSVGTVIPAKSAESTRIPGPDGSRTRESPPPARRIPLKESSAVMRHLIAAAVCTMPACPNGNGSPDAIRSWSATRSSPVTLSVTGCST